jgi:hypothetical protein
MDTTKLEYKMARKQTNYLLELIDSGMIDAQAVVLMALSYMSEDEVADMMRCNDVLVEDDEDFEDEDWDRMDGDFDSGMASAGMGTDEDYGYAGTDY